MSNTQDNEQHLTLTPEQEQELAQARAAAEAEHAERVRLEREAQRIEVETSAIKHAQALQTGVTAALHECGLKPYDFDMVLKLLPMEDSIQIRHLDDELVVTVDGNEVDLRVAVQRFYTRHMHLFEDDKPTQQTYREGDVDDPYYPLIGKDRVLAQMQDRDRPINPQVFARSDFRSLQHRSNWIAKHGFDAFEALPSTRDALLLNRNPRALSADEYKRLTVEERVKVIQKIGADGVAKLMHGRRG